MSIISLLGVGAKGLSASQAGVRSTSQNITNMNTAGYRAQSADVVAASPYSQHGFYQANGVQVVGYSHNANAALDDSLRGATSDSTGASVRSGVLDRAESVFTDMKGTGLSSSLDNLFSAFESFAAAPQDTIARNGVLNAADSFASDFNSYASQLSSLTAEVNEQVDGAVEEINSLTSQISELNDEIAGNGSNVPLDLVDRRDQLMKDLSEKVEIDVITHDNGVADVSLKGSGVPLVISDTQYKLETGTNADGNKTVIGHRHGGDADVTESLRGGKLGGLIAARDTDLAEVGDQLDEMAFNVASAINAVHEAGFDQSGTAGLPMFTTTATAEGAAGALRLNSALEGNPQLLAGAATAADAPGDNTVANQLAELSDTKMADGKTPGEALRGILTSYGEAANRAEVRATATASATTSLEETWQSQSGVSVDEEMTNLMKYQTSYQAAARVVTIADSLLEETIGLVR